MFHEKLKMNDAPKKALTATQVVVLCVVAVVAASAVIAGASVFGDDSTFLKWIGVALALGSTVAASILFFASRSDRRSIPIIFTLVGIALGSIGYLAKSRYPLLSYILFATAIALVLVFKFYRGQFISK
jgi:ABC-type Fe3+-siderophore transport system permease subunit